MRFQLILAVVAMTLPLSVQAETIVDHLQLGVPDVDKGSRQVADLTGVTPAFGGVHPGRGTANALMSLGGRSYLELIGPAAGESPQTPMTRGLAALTKPSLRTFAVETTDIDAVAQAAGRAGLKVSGPAPGSRRTPDGQLLTWRSLNIEDRGFGGFMPFFIAWGSTPHPATTSPAGAALKQFRVEHPRAAELQALYRALGLDIRVDPAAEPRMILEVSTPKGLVTFTGG